MFDRIRSTIIAGSLAITGLIAVVQASESSLPRASYAPVGGQTLIPYGWMDFCGRRPEECNVKRTAPLDVKMTKETWALLNHINRYVNGAIQPVSNFDHWGTMLDHWDYPVDGKGDCKIYALYKRKLLMEEGLPRQALLMTIVFDLNGEGHAIVTVKTDRGEFALDNMSNDIKAWDATGYQFVKRQAQDNPNVWLDLGGARSASASPGFSAVAYK